MSAVVEVMLDSGDASTGLSFKDVKASIRRNEEVPPVYLARY
jgi:hypothetical protein